MEAYGGAINASFTWDEHNGWTLADIVPDAGPDSLKYNSTYVRLCLADFSSGKPAFETAGRLDLVVNGKGDGAKPDSQTTKGLAVELSSISWNLSGGEPGLQIFGFGNDV